MKKRMLVDIGMVVLLPLLMAYSLVGETLHEFGGLLMFALFITHHVLNRGWFGSLRKGRYTAARTLNTVIDLLLLLDMLIMMVSGILISRHALTFLGISSGAMIGRILHMLGAFWGYVLMSVHLGFHGSVMAARMGIRDNKRAGNILRIVFLAISAYGVYAFVKRQFPTYLFLRQFFVFIDTNEPLILFLLDYLAIMIVFATLAYYAMKGLKLSETGNRREKREEVPLEKTEKNVGSGSGKKPAKPKNKKKRLIIWGVILAVVLIAGLVWGIPYVRRHFRTVRIDRAQATAIAPVDLGGKTLVIYFTRTGNSNFAPDVDATSSASLMLDENDVLVGNAELIAQMVENATKGDVWPIRVTEEYSYPSSYGDTISVAGDELDGKITPQIVTEGQPDVRDYDNIIFIYPIWWGTVPKAVEVYARQFDWTGKEVHLVVTHGGSKAGSCPRDMAAMLAGGSVNENVLTVYDDDADEASDQIYEWLKSLK